MSVAGNPIAISQETAEAFGQAVMRRLLDHHGESADSPVGKVARPDALRHVSEEPMPRGPTDPEDVLGALDRDVWPNTLRIDHPRFFGFITSPSTFVGAMADALVAGFNPFPGTWLEGSGPVAAERAAVRWIREWVGLPDGWSGHFTAGGSAANLTGLAAARHAILADDTQGAVVYGSTQTHFSMRRAFRLLGFDDRQIRHLEPDPDFRLQPGGLREAIAADLVAGRRPFCVVANAGTTNTGAVDPLEPVAALCREFGLWLHVDGCYGLAAAFGDRRRTLFAGLERADSVSVDAHKWLFQPYECGCILLNDPSWLRRAFGTRAEYLQDAEGGQGYTNYGDEGLQLTRRFRALKVWMTMKVFGADNLRAAVERGIALGRYTAAELEDRPDWTVMAPADLAIVAFRYEPRAGTPGDADEFQRRIVEEVTLRSFAFISSSVLNGRTVLRMNTINPRTTEEDILRTLDHLEEVARFLAV